MKKFSEIVESKSSNKKLDIQNNTLSYIGVADLKKYLEVCNKFISDEAKAIVKYLIDNNLKYVAELSNDTDDNPLAAFYNAGVPMNATEELKELYKNIGVLYKKDRLMEIPVFQTKEQFEAIITKQESPDCVIMDLVSEKGRNEIAKQYEPLIHKMAKQFHGKSNLSYEELVSAGYQGLVWAMNSYGKKPKQNKNNVDIETIVSNTFTQFAAYMIRTAMLEDIKNLSHTVRIPVSQQNDERKDTGRNTKSNTVSGDRETSLSDDSNKSLFDYMGGTDNATRDVDNEDIKKLWNRFFEKLNSHFDKKTLDIYYSSFGLNGYEKIKKKELADKFKIAQSSITYVLYRVNTFITTDKEMYSMIKSIFELMTECANERDMDYDPEEGLHIEINDDDM